MRKGAGGMVAMMMAMWIDPSAAEPDDVPSRFTTVTLVFWTLIGIALTAAIGGINVVLTGRTAPTWLVASLAVFLPLVAAFLCDPPRRRLGLAVGIVAGVACGGTAWGVVSSDVPGFWSVFTALAAGALAAAWAFGLVTRDAGELGA